MTKPSDDAELPCERDSSPWRLAPQLPLAALEFLTPLRLRRGQSLQPLAIGRSSALFPLVGLLLGAMLLAADDGLEHALPRAVSSALLVAMLALLSGGLHLDGLADSADGLFGGRTPAQRLEIMRDSRIGTFGASALVLVLLLQWSALAALLPPRRAAVLLLFPALGRCAMSFALAAFPYARTEGLGVLFRRSVWPWPAPLACALGLGIAVVLFGWAGVVLWLASLLFAAALGAWITARLGGLTGDSYGAIGELTQVLILLLVLSGQRSGWAQPWLVRG